MVVKRNKKKKVMYMYAALHDKDVIYTCYV